MSSASSSRRRPKVPKCWIRNPSDELAIKEGCWFDEDAGKRACEFVERFCRQSKGRWAGQPLKLLDWQRDFLMRLFGWKRADGTRRFRSAYLEVAKKNGKSTLVSALTLLLLLADGEGAPECYVNAYDRSQASIVYDEASRMVKASPDLLKRLDVVESKKLIVDPIGHGKIVANSADVPSKDGVNAHLIIFDELHRQRDRTLWEIFEYAGESRTQPLTISITTAGESTDGVWHEQREKSEQINAGVVPDTSHLGVVYRALPTDDIDDPATWRKANPSLGVTLSEEEFRRKLDDAKRSPAKLANFLRLRLNIVTAADTAFLPIDAWKKCNRPHVADFSDPGYAGLDLSSTNDLTALVWIVGDTVDGFDVYCMFWLPEDDIVELERKHGVPYRQWAKEGWIQLTPGPVIDYEFIRAHVNEMAEEGDLRMLKVDPYNATELAIDLKEGDGLPVEFIRQGFLSLSAPTKELLRLVIAGKLRHAGNPVLTWMAANAIAQQDAAGNVKLSKHKSRKKIDGMAALVNAIAGAIGPGDDAGESVYETRGITTI